MAKNSKLIYSPRKSIPIGEAVVLPGGVHALCFKHGHGDAAVMETVPLDVIHDMITKKMGKISKQGSQYTEDLAF